MSSEKPKSNNYDNNPYNKIQDINWDEIADDTTAAVLGPRGCGKTTLIYLLMKMKGQKRGIAMCGSGDCWVSYPKWLPMACIYEGFNHGKLSKIMAYQNKLLAVKAMVEHARLEKELGEKIRKEVQLLHQEKVERLVAAAEKHKPDIEVFKKERAKKEKQWQAEEDAEWEKRYDKAKSQLYRSFRKPYTMFVILDDCGSDGSLHDGLVKILVNNGRHYGVFLVFALQNPLDLPPKYRQGICWLFLFYDTTKANIKNLWEKYCSSLFAKPENLLEAMKWAKQKGGVLALHVNHAEQHLFHRSVFFVKTEKLPHNPAPVGAEEFIKLGKEYFDQEKYDKMVEDKLTQAAEEATTKTRGGKRKTKVEEEEPNVKEPPEPQPEFENTDINIEHKGIETVADEEEAYDEPFHVVDEDNTHLQKDDQEKQEKELIRSTQKLLKKEGRRAKRQGDTELSLFSIGEQ